ncbi:hypothetical protein ACFQ1M_07855 [Sungkyunkwania multivorans]|uniref:Uncharacterized protein n=1 Tax=Sungkyunkwania multivorans TaxID=1173618 RepID=A0ABW3CXT1_9FLAO
MLKELNNRLSNMEGKNARGIADILSQVRTEREGSFIASIDSEEAVVYTYENIITYTLDVTASIDEGASFSNMIIQEREGETYAHVVHYSPSEEHGIEAKFYHTNGEVVNEGASETSKWVTTCTYGLSPIWECAAGNPHPPSTCTYGGSHVIGYDFVLQGCETSWEPEFGGGGGGGGSDGSNIGNPTNGSPVGGGGGGGGGLPNLPTDLDCPRNANDGTDPTNPCPLNNNLNFLSNTMTAEQLVTMLNAEIEGADPFFVLEGDGNLPPSNAQTPQELIDLVLSMQGVREATGETIDATYDGISLLQQTVVRDHHFDLFDNGLLQDTKIRVSVKSILQDPVTEYQLVDWHSQLTSNEWIATWEPVPLTNLYPDDQYDYMILQIDGTAYQGLGYQGLGLGWNHYVRIKARINVNTGDMGSGSEIEVSLYPID